MCEVCWFDKNPGRFPISLLRESGDLEVDRCCLCGSIKISRIYFRLDPKTPLLLCGGTHG